MDYYEERLRGLGKAFYDEIIHCIALIEQFPQAWQKVGRKSRKCLVKRFPYMILYIYGKDEIVITAIAHQHRDPQYYSDHIV